MQDTHRSVEIAKYKMVALRGLQIASMEGFAEAEASVTTLATILGLLIYDAISDSREYPALTRLVDSWIRVTPPHRYQPHESTIRFLLDQIQLYVESTSNLKLCDLKDNTNQAFAEQAQRACSPALQIY